MFKNFNWWLVGAFLVTAVLTLVPFWIKPLHDVFFNAADAVNAASQHYDLSTLEYAISFGLAASTVPVFELGKAIRRAVSKKKA